jgi:16S rRNA (guanine966-N2)-methyltransferase
MRIVGGMHRGRTLVAPKGQLTRPTADRTRQAMFNVMEHAAWSPGLTGARVIDLFAGAGALGLESLSRGAAFCLFVDADEAARAATLRNVEALRLGDRARVSGADAARLGEASSPEAGFDLAFLDPPYGQGLAESALAALAAGHWLAPGALVILEQGAGEAPLVAPGFHRLDARDWGAARIEFLKARDRP